MDVLPTRFSSGWNKWVWFSVHMYMDCKMKYSNRLTGFSRPVVRGQRSFVPLQTIVSVSCLLE